MSSVLPYKGVGLNKQELVFFKEEVLRNCKKSKAKNGCWIWHGAFYGRPNARYGSVWIPSKKRSYPAHRVAYTVFRGEIPTGLVVDHLCDKTLCVNPRHLKPTTNRENILRGDNPAARHAKKTHCFRGHKYTEENTYYQKKSYGLSRICRECMRIRWRKKS